jgi:hypothetical protein
LRGLTVIARQASVDTSKVVDPRPIREICVS